MVKIWAKPRYELTSWLSALPPHLTDCNGWTVKKSRIHLTVYLNLLPFIKDSLATVLYTTGCFESVEILQKKEKVKTQWVPTNSPCVLFVPRKYNTIWQCVLQSPINNQDKNPGEYNSHLKWLVDHIWLHPSIAWNTVGWKYATPVTLPA